MPTIDDTARSDFATTLGTAGGLPGIFYTDREPERGLTPGTEWFIVMPPIGS